MHPDVQSRRRALPGFFLCFLPLLLFLFVRAGTVFASEFDLPNYDLSLAEKERLREIRSAAAVELALRSNLQIGVDAITPRIEADRIRQALGDFDPAIELTGRYRQLDTPQNALEYVSTGGTRLSGFTQNTRTRIFFEEEIQGSALLVGRLPLGTQYEIGTRLFQYQNDLTRDPLISPFDPEYRAFVGFTLVQPLLRDGGPVANLTLLRISKLNKSIADIDFKRSVSQVVRDVSAAYCDLWLAYQDVQVKQFEVSLARKIAEEKRAQLEKGTVTPNDMAQAATLLAESYERFLLARQTLLQKNNDLHLKLLVDQDYGTHPLYIPTEGAFPSAEPLDRPALVSDAMRNRPEYLAAVAEAEKAGLELRYRKNQTLPRLDIEGTLGIVGLGRDVSQAFSQATDGQGTEYGIGLTLRVPLGNREAIGKREEARRKREQALLEIKRQEVETMIAIDNAIAAVETHRKRIDATAASTHMANRSLDKARAELEKGAASEIAVLNAERELREARLREKSAVVDQRKALLALWDTTGTLLERQGIEVANLRTPAPTGAAGRSASAPGLNPRARDRR